MQINVVGFPYACDLEGECLDIIRMWIESGISVRVLPTSPIPAPLVTKLTELGCGFLFHLIGKIDGKILEASGLRRGIVVGLYDQAFFKIASRLRMMGCKLVWAGGPAICSAEKSFYQDWGVCEKYVVKSYFHRTFLLEGLSEFGCNIDRVVRIKPPYFADQADFNIVPHVPADIMRIGKLGCAMDDRYYPSNSWKILSQSSVPVRAIASEWSDELETSMHRPKWVDTLPTYRPHQFFSLVHCLVQVAKRKENWLRFALDAMAYGAPVIAQNDGSWKEMIRHGENGFLCNSPEEISELIEMLATDENLRIEMAIRARESLYGGLIDTRASADKWCAIFEDLI